LLATATGVSSCEKFKVIDLNGGDLYSGEQVYLQLGPWYVTADGGGNGAVNVNTTSPSSSGTFTVIKMNGAPGSRITHNDQIAFQASDGVHYVEAVNNGGGSVDAYATSTGPATTFVYWVSHL